MVASVRQPNPHVRRAILYDSGRGEGVYVFPCATEADGSAIGDEWFASFNEAIEACQREYGVQPEDWTVVPDPPEGCQHDWIAHVRIKGRVDGNPQWGRLERRGTDGVWREIREGPDGTWHEVGDPAAG